ncbi:MAG: hypothetical protein HA496_04990 [Thaumarchaeota archaeon]|jgi:hypothetical protein|nr:hypothetical protein [Nitrososphaerota archaeon]
MGKALRIVLIVVEALITLIVLIPVFLWLLLNVYLVNYRIGKNRKKMVKMLRREGLSEDVSIKIAEHMFPKMEFSLLGFRSLMSAAEPAREKRGKLIGKQDR